MFSVAYFIIRINTMRGFYQKFILISKGEIHKMIRKATLEDVSNIAAIYENVILNDDGSVGWKSGIYPTAETAADAIKNDEMFVFDDKGKITATAIINKNQPELYKNASWSFPAGVDDAMVLHTLAVDPNASGKGYGSKFVKFYEEYAKENGCFVLRMDTNVNNKRARTLYNKLGFLDAGIVPCIFNGIPGVSLICLEKKL